MLDQLQDLHNKLAYSSVLDIENKSFDGSKDAHTSLAWQVDLSSGVLDFRWKLSTNFLLLLQFGFMVLDPFSTNISSFATFINLINLMIKLVVCGEYSCLLLCKH